MVHFSTSSLAVVISDDLSLGYSRMGIIMGAWPMLYILLAIPSGLAMDRFGSRLLLLAGIAMITVSVLLRAGAQNFHEMYLAFIVFGLGAPLVSIGVPKVIRECFSTAERGFALGITTAVIALGSVLGLIASQELMLSLNLHWRDVYCLYGSICCLAIVSWLVILRSAGNLWQSMSLPEISATSTVRQISALLDDKGSRLTLALGAGILFYMHATINWLPEIVYRQSSGVSISEAARLAALPIVIAIFSAVLIPRLVRKFPVLGVLNTLLLIAALSCLLLALFSHAGWIIIALVLMGMIRGALMPISTLLIMQLKDVSNKNMGLAMGLFFAFGQIGGVAGPLVIGFLAQYSEGFQIPLLFMTVFCMILVSLVFRIRLHEH